MMGHVVDFLEVRFIQFPVFNIADIAINLGIGCLAIAAIITGKKEKVAKQNAASAEPPQSPDQGS